MVTYRYSLYNENRQLMTKEGNFEAVAEFKYLGTIIANRNEMHKEIKHGSILEMHAIMHYRDFCHPNFSQKH